MYNNEAHHEILGSSAILVIHPGSQNIRIGRASDAAPVTVPHCIARRHKTHGQRRYEDSWLNRSTDQGTDVNSLMDVALVEVEDMLSSRPMTDGTCRIPTNQRKLVKENAVVRPILTNDPSSIQLTNTDSKPETLVGQKALFIDTPSNYSVHWPMRRGHLNIHAGVGGSLTSVISDLETIWRTIITTELDIPHNDFCYYRAIVLVPDTMSHHHMKHLMSLLLDRLQFNSAILHQESVCATYGAGLSSACVVDIGDQKTSVCCVDDGISYKSTRLNLQYGGCDISRCFYDLMLRSGIPLSRLSLDSYPDSLCIQEIKEKFSHLDQDTHGTYEQTIDIQKPGQKHGVQYKVKIGDEAILAPLGLFCPELFGLHGSHLIHAYQNVSPDPDDPYGEAFLHETRRSTQEAATKLARKKDTSLTNAGDDITSAMIDDDSNDAPETDTLKGNLVVDESDDESIDESRRDEDLTLMGVDEAIVRSIERFESDEKKKMYSCILVVGGGAMFAGAMSWLQYRVWTSMSAQARSELEVMDVMNRPRDLDPRMISWNGASLMVSLDTTQELWIKNQEWKRDGVRVLRERSPFIW